jgi:hypothetical protein
MRLKWSDVHFHRCKVRQPQCASLFHRRWCRREQRGPRWVDTVAPSVQLQMLGFAACCWSKSERTGPRGSNGGSIGVAWTLRPAFCRRCLRQVVIRAMWTILCTLTELNLRAVTLQERDSTLCASRSAGLRWASIVESRCIANVRDSATLVWTRGTCDSVSPLVGDCNHCEALSSALRNHAQSQV